jgi:hypothetical protein
MVFPKYKKNYYENYNKCMANVVDLFYRDMKADMQYLSSTRSLNLTTMSTNLRSYLKSMR